MRQWVRRNNFPVVCGCCGTLVIHCWESGHDKACDDCRSHFWRCGPKGDKPCDVRALAKALGTKRDVWPYEIAKELRDAGIEPTTGETITEE